MRELLRNGGTGGERERGRIQRQKSSSGKVRGQMSCGSSQRYANVFGIDLLRFVVNVWLHMCP